MTEQLTEPRIEFCPQARDQVYMDGARCGFCHTDHSLGSRLAPRELDVLRHVAAGDIHKQIAQHLEVNVDSVRNDLWRARTKIGARTTAQAVAMLVREGSL